MAKYEVCESFHRWTTVELDTDSPTASGIIEVLKMRVHLSTPTWAYTDVYATNEEGNATDMILDW